MKDTIIKKFGETKMKKLFCMLGFHRWEYFPTYKPSINAPIVTYFMLNRVCKNCPKTQLLFEKFFDPKTGEPI